MEWLTDWLFDWYGEREMEAIIHDPLVELISGCNCELENNNVQKLKE